MFEDSGFFDQLIDLFDCIIPTVFTIVIPFFKKNKNFFKLMFVLILSIRMLYRVLFMDLKEEKINLNLKLISYIVNIGIITYFIISDHIKSNKEEEKKN